MDEAEVGEFACCSTSGESESLAFCVSGFGGLSFSSTAEPFCFDCSRSSSLRAEHIDAAAHPADSLPPFLAVVSTPVSRRNSLQQGQLSCTPRYDHQTTLVTDVASPAATSSTSCCTSAPPLAAEHPSGRKRLAGPGAADDDPQLPQHSSQHSPRTGAAAQSDRPWFEQYSPVQHRQHRFHRHSWPAAAVSDTSSLPLPPAARASPTPGSSEGGGVQVQAQAQAQLHLDPLAPCSSADGEEPPGRLHSQGSVMAALVQHLAASYYSEYGAVPDVPAHMEQVRCRAGKRQRLMPAEEEA